MFNWPNYLRGLGKAILIIGCLATLVLAFTSIVVNVPGYTYITEFSLSGLITTVAVFFGSLLAHAVFCWFAEMLQTTSAICKQLNSEKSIKQNVQSIQDDEGLKEFQDEY